MSPLVAIVVSVISGLVTGFISGYAGILVATARHAERLLSTIRQIEAIERELGTTDTGIRGAIHKLRSRTSRHDARLVRIEERVGLDPWRDEEL